MKKYDVVIIGGGPSGIVTAMTAQKQNKGKTILMVTREKKGLVPCGIPYVFYDLGDVEKNTMGPKAFVDAGGELLVATVTQFDFKKRCFAIESGEEIGFEKLVLATGSRPFIPTFIKGHDLEKGVEYVPKSYAGISHLKTQTDSARKIIVLGSGFTAVEIAEQLAKNEDKEVHLVFRASHCLHRFFSADFARRIDETLKNTAIHLHANSQIKEITGENGVADGILLEDGSPMTADLIIVAMGYQANTEIAMESGVKVNEYSQIVVDSYLRTNVEGVFAVGDCAQTVDFMTGSVNNIMLASTGAAEARILGYNLYKIRVQRSFPDTLSVFGTELNGNVFASAGVLEQHALEQNVDYLIGQFEDVDRHPGTLPGAHSLAIKLIVSPEGGSIIGCEMMGGKSVGEMINIVALAIQKHVTVFELISFQIGTHPHLNTAPTKYVLIKAAEDALNKILS